MFSRRPGGRFNRGRVSVSGGAKATTPLHSVLTAANVLQAVQVDRGYTLSGASLSALADQSGNAKDYSTPGTKPTFNATGLYGRPTATFDGAAAYMSSSLNLPAPLTTPTYMYWVARQLSWTANDFWFGNGGAAFSHLIQQRTASPQVFMYNNVAANSNSGAAVGSWVLGECLFTGSVSDFMILGATVSGGGNSGNLASTGRQIGASNAGGFGHLEFAALGYLNALPSAGERAALRTLITSYYGGLVTVF